MAEQSRKFGERLGERRLEVGLQHQKDLVARMHKLGDHGLNTNQVSRYEGGEGPLPHERRLEWFAEALETSVADLLAGRLADRKPQENGDLSQLSPDPLRALEQRVTGLIAEVSSLRTAQERLLSRLEPGEDDQEERRG